jgi:hypothetical protein
LLFLRNLPTVIAMSAQQCKQKEKEIDLPKQDKFSAMGMGVESMSYLILFGFYVLVRFRLFSSFYFVFSHYYFF